MEQSPTEKHSTAIFQSNTNKSRPNSMRSNRGRPVSMRRKMSTGQQPTGSFKVEINLTRILSFKGRGQKETQKEIINNETIENDTFDSVQYKKTVAKRWRQKRDNALQQGVFFYNNETIESELASFYKNTNNLPFLYSVGFKEVLQGPTDTGLNPGLILKKDQQVYLSRDAFKNYFKDHFGITPFRSPCEAYVIFPKAGEDYFVVKLVEKKAQIHGSERTFETKIWSSISLKKEFEITLGEHFRVEYAICLNSVLEVEYKNLNIRKINIIQALLRENNVFLFFGEQPDYLKQLNIWTQFG